MFEQSGKKKVLLSVVLTVLVTLVQPVGAAQPASSWTDFFDGQSFELKDPVMRHEGKDIFAARYRAIREAKDSILVMTYGFKGDGTAETYAKELCRRARHGIKVFVLADGHGSPSFKTSGYAEKLVACGAHILFYEDMTFANPRGLLHVLHQKTLVIDGNRALVGSANISNWYLSGGRHSTEIYDLEVEMKGSIACELASQFMWMWNRTKRQKQPEGDIMGGQQMVAEHSANAIPVSELSTSEMWRQYGFRGCQLPAAKKSGPVKREAFSSHSIARSVMSDPLFTEQDLSTYPDQAREFPLLDAYLTAFSLAKKRIWIYAPYFTPGSQFIEALKAAVARNVDVRIVMNEYEQTVGEAAGALSYCAYQKAQRLAIAGAKIYLWTQSQLHRKAGLIDDEVTFFGSDNFYDRGQGYTSELMVFTQNRALVEQMSATMVDSMIATRADGQSIETSSSAISARLEQAETGEAFLCHLLRPLL